jgi:glycosyltransferase involved in cell wall biosynthesis
MGVEIIRHRDSIDIVFCILGIYYQVPIIVARLLGKKVIIGAFGLDHQNAKVVYRKIIVASILEVLMNISYSFTHFIVIESWKLGEEDILARRKSKLRYGAYFSGDTNLFKLIIPIEARPNFIGYFGRFSIEKGTIDFIKAIPLILIKIPNLKVLLVGGGMLDEEVEALINSLGLKSNVELAGWIDYTKLQDYYNKVKLVVIPSKCEGLPNVLLEAVSCGTPVLATPVGGIPDIIIEGETGFILENPSPEEIARKVIYILEDMDRLKRVSLKAKKLVNEQYSFDASITRYAGIIRDLYSAN